MNSLFVRARVTSGHRATGPMATTLTITTGCLAHGYWLRKSVSFGLRAIGPGAARALFFMTATGARASVSMAGSCTALAISVRVTKAGVGKMAAFSTTLQ